MKAGKRAIAITAACIMAACLAGALAACGSSSSSSSSSSTGSAASSSTGSYTLVEQGKLTVASDCDYPPFIQMNGDKPSGFEYDLMNALAEKMGLELNYLAPQKFDSIIPKIKTGGTADVGVSSFTINDERKQEIDFTDPYCDSNQGVITLKSSSYTSYKDLAGKTVAAQSGTTGADWAAENISGCTVLPLDAATDCFNALMAGKVEAVVLDLPTAQYQVKNSFTECQVISEIPTGEQYGIVVSKDNPQLTAALNKALSDIKADGTYDKIYSEYFGVSNS